MSERVTWEPCPHCGDLAALGWAGDEVAEFDCRAGCELSNEQMAELRRRGRQPDSSV